MTAEELTEDVIENYRSNIAQGLFYVEGKPLSLAEYPMYLAIYDGNYQKLLLKTGRQVAKSTTIASFMIAECIGSQFFKSFYISPSAEQTRKFSHTRISKILAYSPDLRKYFVGPESIDNVLLRMLRNGSEMAFTYADDNPDRARGYSADRCCFDANAEVLTRAGWRRVKDITFHDEIADVNDEGLVEWHHPSDVFSKLHRGAMVQFNHAGMRLRVTGDHKMWVNYAVKTSPAYKTPDKYQFVPAIELSRSERMGFKMTNRCRFPGFNGIKKTLEGSPNGYSVSRSAVTVDYNAFIELMGWYLAEGHTQRRGGKNSNGTYTVVITQNEGRFSREIERCIQECGFKYSKQQRQNTAKTKNLINRYVIASSQLGEYCAKLGLSRDKYIPEEFFEHPGQLEILLKALYAGDASFHKSQPWDCGTLRTRSRRLADDVHRAWAAIGRAAVIHTRMMPPRKGAKPQPLYEVQAYQDSYTVFWRFEFESKQRIVEEHVDGEEVYCFTVPHHRPLVRGGFGQRPVIAGQCFDEVQDILFEPVVPVIEECMSASKYAYSFYCGTPKTSENTIEFLWSLSSQSEWCMRCDGCSKSTFIDSPKAMGKYGPECLNCRKPLNPRNGRWVDMNPKGKVKGFHISQPMMLYNVPAAHSLGSQDYKLAMKKWENLLFKLDNWGEVKFLNECLGISTSTGARLLTKDLLEGLCDENLEMTRLPMPRSLDGIIRVVAGVDWSGGGGEVKGMEGLLKSRTVLHIWGEQPDGRLRTLYYKIFPNGHPLGWVEEIVELCNAWSVQQVCGDAGEGALANAMLRDKLGAHRVVQVRYMAMGKPMQWNPDTLSYHADRTTLIDNYAMFLKHGKAIYPRIAHAAPAITDILNVFEETTRAGRKIWNHAPTQPDDCLHAQLFGWIAWKIVTGDVKFYV
jgi:hypothetical protein